MCSEASPLLIKVSLHLFKADSLEMLKNLFFSSVNGPDPNACKDYDLKRPNLSVTWNY